MITKHFLKTLVIFMVMIIVGLIGVFLVSFFDNEDQGADMSNAIQNVENRAV